MSELVKVVKAASVIVVPPLLVRGFLDIAGADRDAKDFFTFVTVVASLEAVALAYTKGATSERVGKSVREYFLDKREVHVNEKDRS